MKLNLTSAAASVGCSLLLSLALPGTANASLANYINVAYQNDFSSLTDAGWTHVNAFALSTGQTWSAATGAYRMTAIPNGYNPGNGQYGFVGSVPTGLVFGNGYVQSDVVSFQGGGPTQQPYGPFGIGARLANLGTPLGLTGYAIVYEPYGNSGGPTIRLERLGPPGIFNSLGSLNVNITPGGQYTFTLETTGSSIVGSLWQVGQVGTVPGLVGQVSATDATYTSGAVGLFSVVQAPMPTVDTTWDNFIVMVPEPGTATLLGLGLVGFLAARRRQAK